MKKVYIILYLDKFDYTCVDKVFTTEEAAQSYIVEQVFNKHWFDENLTVEGMEITKTNLLRYFDEYIDWELESIGYTYIAQELED